MEYLRLINNLNKFQIEKVVYDAVSFEYKVKYFNIQDEDTDPILTSEDSIKIIEDVSSNPSINNALKNQFAQKASGDIDSIINMLSQKMGPLRVLDYKNNYSSDIEKTKANNSNITALGIIERRIKYLKLIENKLKLLYLETKNSDFYENDSMSITNITNILDGNKATMVLSKQEVAVLFFLAKEMGIIKFDNDSPTLVNNSKRNSFIENNFLYTDKSKKICPIKDTGSDFNKALSKNKDTGLDLIFGLKNYMSSKFDSVIDEIKERKNLLYPNQNHK